MLGQLGKGMRGTSKTLTVRVSNDSNLSPSIMLTQMYIQTLLSHFLCVRIPTQLHSPF
jgi:hypothetical protein